MIEKASAADLDPDIRWEKSVCRFCGVGCGLVVGTKNGHIAAVKGDPQCSVNRGLLCVKGYANASILYGADRLHKPLLRMKDGVFHKDGDFTEVSWERAFDEMVHQRNGDIGHQQAGDCLVDAAIVTESANCTDPKPAD